MVDETLGFPERARAFIEQMARMSTPYDEEAMAEWRRENGFPVSEHTDEEVRGEIYADYSGDDALEEASSFWELIEEARKILAAELVENAR